VAEVVVTTIVAPNPGPFTLDGSRTYVLDGEVVIDPGPDIPSHVEAVCAAAPRLQAIFITHAHADHAPAAGPLKSRTGAAVIAPPGVVPQVANQHLADGAIWTFGSIRLEALATPGHTPEHFCFLTAEADLFSGDTVLGEGTTVVSPPEGNMRAYLESLQRLRERAPRRIYPGHGPVREDAVAWIDYYIAHRRQREEQILSLLREGGRSIRDLRAAIYPDLDARLHRAAELQIAAHLEDLLERTPITLRSETYLLQE
jgi:glyoxylase-like metal-dependent hydrolase (beta-lactamase superfamily II)